MKAKKAKKESPNWPNVEPTIRLRLFVSFRFVSFRFVSFRFVSRERERETEKYLLEGERKDGGAIVFFSWSNAAG